MEQIKNLTLALSLKEEGNREFKHKRNESSLKCYTKALFYAPCLSSVLQVTADTLRESCTDDRLKLYVTGNNLPPTDKGVEDNLIVAHCYGNRSAALFNMNKYKAALADIDLAMYHGYPKEEFKLYKRKALCLSHLGRQSEALEVMEVFKENARHLVSTVKIRSDVDKVIGDIRLINVAPCLESREDVTNKTFISPSLQFNSSPDHKRGVKAKKRIPFGERVLSEYPHVSLLNREYKYSHCSHCFKETLNIIPCCYCVYCGYCSMSCMKTAWTQYHWAECIHNVEIQSEVDELPILVIRLLFISSRDVKVLLNECQVSNLNQAITKLTADDSTDISDTYKSVLKLVTSSKNYIAQNEWLFKKRFDEIIACHMDTLLSYFELDHSSLPVINSLIEILNLHLLQLHDNYLAVDVDAIPSHYDPLMAMQKVETQMLGSALYLIASKFTHSCDHNLFRNFFGSNKMDVLVCCSLLRKNDDMCLSFGPKIGYQKRSERQKELRDVRNFECACTMCISSDKETLHREYGWYGLSCPKCNGGLLPEPDDFSIISNGRVMSKCIDCGQSTDIIPLIKRKNTILNRKEGSLSDVLESFQMLSEILYKYNNELKTYCQKIASIYLSQGDYISAVKYSKQRCDILKAIHGQYSVELASVSTNHCKLLSLSGDTAKSKELALRAKTVVEFYYGEDDDDAKSLRELLEIS